LGLSTDGMLGHKPHAGFQNHGDNAFFGFRGVDNPYIDRYGSPPSDLSPPDSQAASSIERATLSGLQFSYLLLSHLP
jgi:hypothetical protein